MHPVVLDECESWTIKKAERWRIDVFELWGWRGLLRVPWTTKRSNQSMLNEINPEYSLEGLMCWSSSTLATWFKESAHWKRSWCWEKLKAKEEDSCRGGTLSLSRVFVVVQPLSCLTLCDPIDSSKIGFPVLHYLLELAETHIHWVIDGCHPAILFSVTSFSLCLQSFPASGSFPISWLFASVGHSIGASASA